LQQKCVIIASLPALHHWIYSYTLATYKIVVHIWVLVLQFIEEKISSIIILCIMACSIVQYTFSAYHAHWTSFTLPAQKSYKDASAKTVSKDLKSARYVQKGFLT